jgi:hypothetical protein
MGIKSNIVAVSFLALLASQGVFAQAQISEPEAEQVRVQSSFLIVDRPLAIIGEVDPTFSASVLMTEGELDGPALTQRLNSIREYINSMGQLEAAGGAWDPNLAEELTALGLLQQEQGQHLEAIEALIRAIHVSRVNAGLHTLDQIPAVESLIESYEAIGDWQQADLYHNYLFYVQSKAYGYEDPRIIPVLNSLAKWNVRAFNVGYGEVLGVRLSSAQLLFNAAARMVDLHFGTQDRRFVENMEGIASSAFLVSRNPELMAELNRPEYRNSQEMLRDKLNEITPILPWGYQSGAQALQMIIDHYAQQEEITPELVKAISNLGDWYLLFERRNAATELYTKAWHLLESVENGEELRQQMYGQAVPLPQFDGDSNELDKVRDRDPQSSPVRAGFADLSFDVTTNGLVRNLSILTEETDANANQLNRLRRQVRTSIFRPQIVDGKPVRTDGNQFRYRYWY